MKQITITRPDDWHVHLRDGDTLRTVTPHTAAEFARAVVMPNLKPPVINAEQALAYRNRILAHSEGHDFNPLMTLYLTDNTTREDIVAAANSPHIVAAKLYPSGATTNSDSGVSKMLNIMPALEAMSEFGLVLQIHGEVTDAHIDVFDREALFIDQVLYTLRLELPELRIVLEHITTKQGVEFVDAHGENTAATITPHHLWYNRNALFKGGIRPHFFCLPVLKREEHRIALLEAATRGSAHYFIGTDSAPHAKHDKESDCGCAGIYSAHAALPLYTSIFEQMNKLEQLEQFTSFAGPDFYGLPRNHEKISLIKKPWLAPDSYTIDHSREVVPMCAGETIEWQIQANSSC